MPLPRCKHCGTPFTPRSGRLPLFCCFACSAAYRVRPATERFNEKIDRNGPLPARYPELGPCWLWTGTKIGRGYGEFDTGYAHRFAWQQANGAIPATVIGGNGKRGKTCVCHACDTMLCVNPAHLFLGTYWDNHRDMDLKGRRRPNTAPMLTAIAMHSERLARGDRHGARLHPETRPRGERSGTARLTDRAVREIRARYAQAKTPQRELAQEYGVSLHTVNWIVQRKSWAHLA